MSRLETGWLSSVVHRVRALAPVTLGLAALVLAVEVVHGFRIVGTAWLGGEFLNHGALAEEILRGELPPGGPYAGMATTFPPGFHLLLAGAMALTGFDAVRADQILTIVWLPVLPLGTFILTRHVTGRPWVALVAATLTVFGGGYDLGPGRQWVSSLFLSGQQAYPLVPRDVAFAILPFAVLAFLRSIEPRGRSGSVLKWAVVAGLLLGVATLVDVDLLLPLPITLFATAIVVARRDPARRVPAVASLATTTIVAAATVAAWLIPRLARAAEGVAGFDVADGLDPARFGFWSYPIELGLLLPFAIVGAVAMLILLRLDGSPLLPVTLRRWRPDPVEGPLLLVVWWLVPFALAIVGAAWPVSFLVRPELMWLVASQPLAILAAIGLSTATEALLRTRWRQPSLVAPSVAVVVLLACAPATAATAGIVGAAWPRPAFAHLDLETDSVPDFRAMLGDRGTRPRTVVTYEDWSSLVWFLAGEKVVAIVPDASSRAGATPGGGRRDAERRNDLARGFSGDPAALAAVADRYGATTAIVARRGDRLGLVDIPAGLLEPVAGTRIVTGDGWDGVELRAGARVTLPLAISGPIELDIRIISAQIAAGHAPTLAIYAVNAGGTVRALGGGAARRTTAVSSVLHVGGSLVAGERLAIAASDTVTIEGVRGYVPASSIPGWTIVRDTPTAVVLERAR
ncbi:MAG TPA: hypothetical protein VKA85_07610 [Candidatus Limnocylindrales bacterium]|nr:hypothetical protein [Candidatus Limnocylindrales bacterium]